MCRDGKVHGFVVSSDMQSKAGLLVENERDSFLYGRYFRAIPEWTVLFTRLLLSVLFPWLVVFKGPNPAPGINQVTLRPIVQQPP
jgi:hypothetical protein